MPNPRPRPLHIASPPAPPPPPPPSTPPHKRGPWSQHEDHTLLQLVRSQGAHNWVRISHIIGTRSPKQCRERYHQNLKPTLNHQPITAEEGALIERLVDDMGKRWAEIARRLRGRSDNAVKNWWNGGLNRRRRLGQRRSRDCDRFGGRAAESHAAILPLPSLGLTLGLDLSLPSRRPSDAPLPSPTTSISESIPSLISDVGSPPQLSPRLPPSPLMSLPPLIACQTRRRSSLPLLHMGLGVFDDEKELTRDGMLVKDVLNLMQPTVMFDRLQGARARAKDGQQQPLPPIRSVTGPLLADAAARLRADSRMALTSLLA
ncbi:MAG: hypothetical protein M1829_005288 [Trizodia sp. TS-e1964]|nr:MAG: hypothetical protein M1829_005288 [Trizodia sp. TS-e1964]